MSRLAQNKYLWLLLALALLLVLYPFLTGTFLERLSFDVLLTLVFLAAVGVVFADRRWRPVVLLAAPTLLGMWTEYALPWFAGRAITVGFHLCAALFFALTVATILREISRQEAVTRDSIFGAFCGYVLVGLTFAHVYCILETVLPGSFEGRELIAGRLPPSRLVYLLNYFSLITLTTVGFGDVAPATDGARGLSAVEAIVGQFYIAVLIAELIGRRLARRG
jgi:hypothetical protein